MSRYDSGGVYSQSSRPRVGASLDTRTIGLDAPGELPIPPDFSKEHALNDFANVMGLSLELAGQLERKREQETARDEKEKAQIDSVLRGEGAYKFELEFPKLASEIEQGNIAVEGEESDVAATRILDAATTGMPEAMAAGYRRGGGRLSAQIQRFKDEARGAAAELAVKSFNSDAVSARTPEELTAAYSAANSLLNDPLKAQQVTYLSALRAAADAGDSQRFEMVKGVMGQETFAPEIEKATADLASSSNAIQARRNNDFRDAFGSQMIDLYNGVGAVSVEGMRQSIEQSGADGETKRTAREHLDSVERQMRSATTAQIRVERDNAAKSQHLMDAYSMGQAGSLAMVGSLEQEFPDGSSVKMSKEETIRKVFAAQNFVALSKFPDNPAAARDVMIGFALQNGIPDPEWKDILQAGYGAVSEASTAQEGKALPPASGEGFTLYKRLFDSAPNLIDVMGLSEKARDLYDTSAALQDSKAIGGTTNTDAQVLNQAARMLSNPLSPVIDADTRKAITTAAQSAAAPWFALNATNAGELAQHITSKASLYVRGGASPENAAMRASDEVTRSGMILNKRFITAADLPAAVREAMPAILAEVTTAFGKEHPQNPSFVAGKVTLAPSPRTGFWALIDNTTGMTISDDPSKAIFTTAQLETIYRGQQSAIDKAARDAAVKAQAAIKDRKPLFDPEREKRLPAGVRP